MVKYKSPNYEIACEVAKGGFTEYEQYLAAKVVGASTLEEYQLVLKYHAPDFESAYAVDLGGFPCYELYEVVKQKQLLTFEELLNNIV